MKSKLKKSKIFCRFRKNQRFFQKKAGLESYLLILIVVLVLIVVFAFIYNDIKKKTEYGAIREIRRENIKKQADAHIVGLDFSSQLNFPIIKMSVKEKDIPKDLSRALVEDWSDLLRAKKELFPIETDKIVYCIQGHYIEFKDKNKKFPLKELAKYQKTNTVGNTGATGIISEINSPISNYLAGYSTDKAIFEEEVKQLKESLEQYTPNEDEFFSEGNVLNPEYSINTNNDYITVFVYMKKGYWMKWLSSVIGTGIGTTGGFILGIVLVPFTWGGSLIISAIAIGGGISGGAIGYKTGSDKSADWDAGIFLVPNKADVLKNLKCDILPARGETE